MRSSTRSSAQRGRHLGGAAGAAGSVLRGPAAGCGDRDLREFSGRGGPGNDLAGGGAGNVARPEPVTTDISTPAEKQIHSKVR